METTQPSDHAHPGGIASLPGVQPIDREIFQAEQGFTRDRHEVQRRRLELVRSALAHHLENCRPYRDYCRAVGFDASRIRSYRDLSSIPLLPSPLFKKAVIRSVSEEQIAKVCTSSGTRGSVSRVARDSATMFRFLGSVRFGLDNLVCEIGKARVYNLGPSTEEARDLWFSYVMSITNLFYSTRNYVVNETFEVDRLLKDLATEPAVRANDYERFVVVGAPIMFLELFEAMRTRGVRVRMGERALAITAGGWKKHRNRAVARDEFEAMACEYLGIPDRRSIRDALNLVELNTVLFECELKKKHVPPWLVVATKDVYTLEDLPPGQEGVIAYLDPSPTSYPAFLLSEDLGYLEEFSSCPCGRGGETLHLTRRLSTVESRGCALKLAQGRRKP